jgi:outer membrane protein assembly factor BamB
MMHGDARRTHRVGAKGPEKGEVFAELKLPGPVLAQVIPCPDGSCLYAASLDGKLYRIRLEAGAPPALAWAAELNERVYGTPIVTAKGTVYVGSDSKRLYAIDAAGKTQWRFDAEDEVDTAGLISASDLIVFGAGKHLFGLRSDGTSAFRTEVRGKVFGSPALLPSGSIVFGAQDNRVYGVSASGGQLFAVDLGGDVDGAPAVADDGSFFVGTDQEEVVHLSERGAVLWRKKYSGYVRGALSIARNGDVLFGTYGPNPGLYRVSEKTGDVLGVFSIVGTGSKDFGVVGGALEDASGTLYFGAQDDILYAVGPEGEKWRKKLNGDIDAPLTLLADGTLVAATSKGSVYLIKD